MNRTFFELEITNSANRLRANNLICLARTYSEHAKELGNEVPTDPIVFLKPNSALIGDGEAIVLPAESADVHHEVELAVVIGKTGRAIIKEKALDYVLGYAVFLDITARDIQSKLKKQGLSWAYAKGWNTFAPISKVVPKELVPNPQNLKLRLTVSGEVRQDANTEQMMLTIPEIISYVSSFMTLQPGDIIATGTPKGVSALKVGDTTVAEIDQVGTLTNSVIASQ